MWRVVVPSIVSRSRGRGSIDKERQQQDGAGEGCDSCGSLHWQVTSLPDKFVRPVWSASQSIRFFRLANVGTIEKGVRICE